MHTADVDSVFSSSLRERRHIVGIERELDGLASDVVGRFLQVIDQITRDLTDLNEQMRLVQVVPEAISAHDNKVALEQLERARRGRFGTVADQCLGVIVVVCLRCCCCGGRSELVVSRCGRRLWVDC